MGALSWRMYFVANLTAAQDCMRFEAAACRSFVPSDPSRQK